MGKHAKPVSEKPVHTINIAHGHEYCFNIPTIAEHQSTSLLQPKSQLSSFVPMMGPLHISLNSKEHVFLTFWPFFQLCYEYLFPNCALPVKPKTVAHQLTARTYLWSIASDSFSDIKNILPVERPPICHFAKPLGQLHATCSIHLFSNIQIKQF